MSNINYDIMRNVTYDERYKHYLARYQVAFRPWKIIDSWDHRVWTTYWDCYVKYGYDAAISFDDGNEISVTGEYTHHYGYSSNEGIIGSKTPPAYYITVPVQESGPFSKVYFRDTHPEYAPFTEDTTFFRIQYSTKADFVIQFNTVGFAANENASFRCSTVAQNVISQYEWTAATVYYKKSTDTSYSSVNATVSGSWSDVKVSTTFGFEDGYTYDVYIKATADDGTTAQTPVAQFTTEDTGAVATCISPVGAFTNGEVRFAWSHSTSYGTPQHAYDLRYSSNNGGTWTTLANHEVTTTSTFLATIDVAGNYIWQVRTYNSNDVVGEWSQAAFVNNVPATAPTNLTVTTEGRPTVSWIAASQSAFQVQVLSGDEIVYDSGAVYSAQTKHIVNKYLYDVKAYVVKVRVYNALGDVSGWVSTGYQQPAIDDVVFKVEQAPAGGATIVITENEVFTKYYILRNKVPIALVNSNTYSDIFSVGDVNYSVVGVTANDNSDIKTVGLKVVYPKAMIVTLEGATYAVNKRFNESYKIKTSSQIDYSKAKYIGNEKPAFYADKMVEKSFSITCFDEYGTLEGLIGKIVFYADNFGNGGYCFVTGYAKENDYLQTSDGTFANEVSLTLEVTDYDDSIKYEL